jgi:hypothetical protein
MIHIFEIKKKFWNENSIQASCKRSNKAMRILSLDNGIIFDGEF